jgi:hypothetical protein
MKLNNARLKTLPLDKSVCDGANLYFTRPGPERGKWSFRYQRLGKKREMGLGPYPAIGLAEARQRCPRILSTKKAPIVSGGENDQGVKSTEC